MSSPGQTNRAGLSRTDLLRISESISATHGLGGADRFTTELVLLEVDPWRLHAYWHIEHSDLFRARVAAGDPCASLVIRIREAEPDSGTGWIPKEELVTGLTRSHYLEAPVNGTGCYAEIGLKLQDGSLHALVRSNIAYPPRQRESPVYEMIAVDTRVRRDPPAEDVHFGETMLVPLQLDTLDVDASRSSWS